jgi:hypothetical protein
MQGSPQISFPGLTFESGALAIVSNWGSTQEIAVGFAGNCRVANPLMGELIEVRFQNGVSASTLTLPAEETVLLEARNH